MTFKRVMLVVLPLLAAILVYMALRLLYSNWEASFVAVHTPLPDGTATRIPTGGARLKMQGIEHDSSGGVNLERKDKAGRRDLRFMADIIIHKTPTTSDIERPRIQLFTKAGEIITLIADQGTLVSKGSVTNLSNIESGVLSGNVVMVHDRGTPDDETDDITATMDDLRFNGDMSELSTDGPVVMAGVDMMLTARKMRMAIDRKTRRINTMTFMQDIRITLATGDRSIGLPTPSGAAPGASGAAKGGPAAAPAAAPKAAAAPAAGAAAAPAAGQAPEETGELWRIDLAGDVDARQGEQRLQCDRLGLYNRPSKTPPPGQADARPAAPATDVAAAAPVSPAAPRPTRAGSATGRTRQGAAARVLRPDAPPPLLVIADGPLIITPISPEERKVLGDAAHMVVATGAPVTVDDAQTHVVGAEVQYNIQTGSGSIIGKESPMLLEQPGRLRLTGGRLDFDRAVRPGHPYATADVNGEGQLYALAQGMSLTGKAKKAPPASDPAAAAAPAAPPAPPTPLEAVWARSMHLEFYQLPTDTSAGLGEISRATFSGRAVVKQAEGTMKGDELAIDFSRSLPGRGQAVDRLVGHGDVFIKNQPPEAAPEAAPRVAPAAGPGPAAGPSKMAVGDIACQHLDIAFERDAAGDTQPRELKAKGAVDINDPSGKIRAEDLVVKFGPAAQGGGVDPQFFEAFGNVLVDREDLHAEGDHVRRDMAGGTLLMEGKPARAGRGASRVAGPRIEFNEAEGTAVVRGAGELEMLSAADLRGRQRKQAEPMLLKWKNSMLYVDKRNFAQFDGGASATTGASRLSAERIWVYFADKPAAGSAPTAPGRAAPAAAAAPVAPSPGAPPPKGGKSKSAAGKAAGGTDMLLGKNKALVRLFAEKDAHAIDQQWDADNKLRFMMEIIGDNLTYVDDSRKAYIRGPGRLRILARERPKPGEAETPGLAPEALIGIWQGKPPDGYSRTEVAWAESMAYDGATDRAYFKGAVETVNTGRSSPAGGAQAGAAKVIRLESADLQAIFSEKPPPAAATASAVPAVAATPSAPPPDVPREERMAVEKMIADGGVRLWVDDRRGACERLIYQRVPEEIRLYRGMDDWARLWQENEASQEFGEIVARAISFEPATGRISVVEQQSLAFSPKPRANPPAKSAPKPTFKP